MTELEEIRLALISRKFEVCVPSLLGLVLVMSLFQRHFISYLQSPCTERIASPQRRYQCLKSNELNTSGHEMAGQCDGKTEPQRVNAVRIPCCGERCTGVEDMSEHDISLDHDVFDLGEECPISKIIGMPILVSKI